MSTIEVSKLTREPVKSSSIKSVGYDDTDNTLHVEFHNGKVYKYHNVSEDHHKMLMDAKSVGSHFTMFIKNNFRYTKI